MPVPFLGELKLVPFNFAPKGWAFCNGQTLPIAQNQALFSLFGTMYGGNGQTTFALPDLRGRTPIHVGSGRTEGVAGGQEFHTVTLPELPAHNHLMTVSQLNADNPIPTGRLLASSNNAYADLAAPTTTHPQTLTNVGGSQAHENRQPFLTLNWIVALQGEFPSHS